MKRALACLESPRKGGTWFQVLERDFKRKLLKKIENALFLAFFFG